MPGKPTVRKAQSLGGNRMIEKRTPVAERCHVPGLRPESACEARGVKVAGAFVSNSHR